MKKDNTTIMHPFWKIRKQLELTTKEFGAMVGLSPSSVTGVETFTTRIGYQRVARTADAFDLDINDLWTATKDAERRHLKELKALAETKYKEALKNGHVIQL